MVDADRVARLLRSISDDLAVLRAESGSGPDRRADPLWMRGIKYVFVTAIEACVDVAQHICSSEGWGPPKDNADAVRTLGRHGVLDPALADRVARAVGFRNVLVAIRKLTRYKTIATWPRLAGKRGHADELVVGAAVDLEHPERPPVTRQDGVHGAVNAVLAQDLRRPETLFHSPGGWRSPYFPCERITGRGSKIRTHGRNANHARRPSDAGTNQEMVFRRDVSRTLEKSARSA